MIVQLHRGTAAQWAADNPVLAYGEPGWASDTRVLKFGDGVTAWNSLPAFAGGAGAPASGAYPLAAYGFHSASEEPSVCTQNSSLVHAVYARVFVPAGKAVTVVAAMVRNCLLYTSPSPRD